MTRTQLKSLASTGLAFVLVCVVVFVAQVVVSLLVQD